MVTALKLKYVGPKPLPFVRQLPVPFVSLSDHRGVVSFNPEGIISLEDGARHLVGLGVFEVLDEIDDGVPEGDEGGPIEMPLCGCNCGTRLVWKKAYKYMDKLPKYLPGHNVRTERSAAGIS